VADGVGVIGQYQPRPPVYPALQWAGDAALARELAGDAWGEIVRQDGDDLVVLADVGELRCPPGNWLVRGPRGQFSVLPPAVFDERFAPV